MRRGLPDSGNRCGGGGWRSGAQRRTARPGAASRAAAASPARTDSRCQRFPERGPLRRPRYPGLDQAAFDQAMARTAGCFDCVFMMRVAVASYPSRAATSVNKPRANARKSGFLEAVAHTVQGFDHLEIVVHDLELLAQPLDVAVDGAIVDIDLIVIGRATQGVAAFHDAGTPGPRPP